MKKKITCLFAALFTFAFTAIPLFISAVGLNSAPAYGSDFVEVGNGTDIKKAASVNDKSITVNATFYDADLDEIGINLKANNYVVWSNDIDSPIRGISDLSIYTDLGSYGVYSDNVKVVCYTSYNHLDFIDIQLGKYNDLNTLGMFSFYPTPLGGGNVKYSVDNVTARYFLMVIMTKIDLHITDVKVYSQCGDEPSGSEDIGEYNSYTSYELENLPENFPFIGNGSYESSISSGSESTFYISGLKGLIDDFRYRLVEYGFTLVDISGDAVKTYTYEKDNPDKTGDDDAYFKLTRTEGIVYDDFVFNESITYSFVPTYWLGPEEKSNWPTEHIATYLENPGYAYIYSDPFIRLENVHYIIDGCFVFTTWNTIDENSLSIVLEDTRAYRERLIDLGFILITDTFSPKSSGEPYGLANIKLYSPHLDYYMFMIYQVDGPNKKCSLTFEFRPKNEMSRTEFNEILLEKGLPGFAEGNMVFLKEEDYYYASPLTIKDLTLYFEALIAAEIDVSFVSKEQLLSSKIVIDRYENSLIYQVHL